MSTGGPGGRSAPEDGGGRGTVRSLTHYDRLGVAPTASEGEIRDAYRRRARTLHPDRHSSASATEQQRASADMAAVNEAWRVLGDPARRRQYDRQQAERLAPSRPTTSQRAASSVRAFEREPAEPNDHTNDVVMHAMRGAPLVAMLLVLLLIFVVTAFASRNASKSNPGSSGRGLQVGSCVVVATGEPVVDVPCSEPHDGVAAAIVPLELPCPSHTEYYVAPGGGARVCVSPDGAP